MSLITKSQATNDLGSFLPLLRGIMIGSWSDYINDYPEKLRVIHCARTRANIVHDHQIERASKFAIENGFQLINYSDMKVLSIGSYAIRFKKFDEELLSSNQPTKQVLKFRDQESLPGFSETFNLEAGYVLTESRTDIYKTCLVQPSGKGINWHLELLDSETKTVVDDLFAKRENSQPTEESEGVTIRGKDNKITPIQKATE